VPLADLTLDEARAMLLAAWRRHAPQSALATLAAEQVPLDRHRLAGYWNDDLVYSGAMENMVLFFGRDGRGCFAWENFGGSHGCVLAWSLEGDRLTTRTVREFSSVPGNGIPMDLDAVLVSVGMEGGPYGTRPLVLRIDGPRHFPFPNALGYVGPRCPERLWRWVGRARK
jgi:hypothetical protein